ncbi:hypothetical protein [Flavobacterium psychrotolerans]|uniref:hypothetical protein n=1 Tax=Flavobacterium psychrotolerans TaxID=2169410 RepID=UPI001AA08965|nr:hypothetical protein [Flavobacterium psychrotolerans]
MNLENLGLVELDAQEIQVVEGGFTFFKLTITGVLDGIAKNTQSDFVLLGFKLW